MSGGMRRRRRVSLDEALAAALGVDLPEAFGFVALRSR